MRRRPAATVLVPALSGRDSISESEGIHKGCPYARWFGRNGQGGGKSFPYGARPGGHRGPRGRPLATICLAGGSRTATTRYPRSPAGLVQSSSETSFPTTGARGQKAPRRAFLRVVKPSAIPQKFHLFTVILSMLLLPYGWVIARVLYGELWWRGNAHTARSQE